MTDNDLMQLSGKIGQQLHRLQATITTAESCTGGWMAKVLTDIAGSSCWFERGFVTYSNHAKQEMTGVTPDSLARYGAVSEPVVREMAEGARLAAGADFAISVSGIAGPDGGSDEKPVGTVWFGFAAVNQETFAQRQVFSGDRESVRRQATAWGLLTLYTHFLKN
ncbi:nicotinamide-nucleotide amidase [Erwinia psidii]|uniref:Nicotinamide-nucleotide amidase n=1 Tax=Erwinia psidii TaxID=69224 RepID=A0A3N6TPB5_9GAMM|nr:nicotinamide-nucleotide amidase [Erwinia psidii]MCX8958092.1 nicotinamide-nucleotide amidase [Erwinia psidii]MCX8962492.1 nicotinamide-nucleotide amidase [Erwinia psidii]MCX8966374.1 nicotinamide-nucleotide amidase [Erwinia psidii]RQM37072.1 nicotinamide-nucleotide amidase [Erwinia psidii]